MGGGGKNAFGLEALILALFLPWRKAALQPLELIDGCRLQRLAAVAAVRVRAKSGVKIYGDGGERDSASSVLKTTQSSFPTGAGVFFSASKDAATHHRNTIAETCG